MNIVLIDYKSGNTRSVLFALERLGIEAIVSGEAEVISSADKVIFPGVGEAASAMHNLHEGGLTALIPALRQPVLGICLGLQLFCTHTEERDTPCLGIFDCRVKKFPATVKVPQIGWNTIGGLDSPLFRGIGENAFMYFVHSYYAETQNNTIAHAEYGTGYSAAMQKDNFYAVQFHPEKSGAEGQQVLKNFIELCN